MLQLHQYSPNLSELNIFSLISELEVYEKYWKSNLLIHFPYSSPLRVDKNPSFNLFICNKTGRLKWKDFATGQVGTVIEFVKYIKQLSSNEESMRLINLDFKLNLNDKVISYEYFTINPFEVNKSNIRYNQHTNKIKKQFEFETLFWTNSSYSYFRDYNISISTLNKYNVSPVKKINLGDKTVSQYSTSNPIYHYSFGNEKWKTLQPNNEKYKWLSNIDTNTIEGFEQILNSCGDKPLILTKSLKDVMVLNELDYPAVSLTNENASLDNKIERLSNFKDIIVLYDNDETGINSSNKIAAQYELKQIFIPKETGIKDISDFSKHTDLNQTRDLFENLTNGI